MNAIIVGLTIAAFFILVAGGLIGYALSSFNVVKAGANVGKAGFFIEAKGKKRSEK